MQKNISLRLTPENAFDINRIRKSLHLSEDDVLVITRRSIDARRRDVMVDLMCTVNPDVVEKHCFALNECNSDKQAIVVGSGPAGLFAALTLIERGIRPIVLERGKDVHSRRVDIAKISTQGIVDPNSNYSFGEGGAGTYSDGKLFTRSHKRGDNDKVLGTFVQFGADESILYDAHPHIGTDVLPKIVENMRNAIVKCGGVFLFKNQVTKLLVKNNRCIGVVSTDLDDNSQHEYIGSVILAIGNAARDTFRMLLNNGVALNSKSLAIGVRLEHPQHLIDQIQYHNPNGRGKYLPAAEYSLSTQVEIDGRKTGVYSFCMCPGGFVVPAASDKDQVVVNGMSPSTRGSVWANSGIVVEYPVSLVSDNPLAMVDLQTELEKRTFEAADFTQKAPAQRMTDFLSRKTSQTLPKSSYAPGLTSYELSNVIPEFVSSALSKGFINFSRQVPGFLTDEAILIGTETRTSSPVRIERDPVTLESISLKGLYPCGEGAGYAGGIVSAAVDGMRCAEKI